MPDWIELNIRSCRRVFGDDVPILLSDDASPESGQIQKLAEKMGCHYTQSDVRRGHFAGDVQAMVNSIVFAKQLGKKIACKISQRMILADAGIPVLAEHSLEPEGMLLALPGRPHPRWICGSKGFARYSNLTDVIFFRADRLDPQVILDTYKTAWQTGTAAHDCIPEIAIGRSIESGVLAGKAVVLDELTNHQPGRAKRFLRRYMSSPAEFRRHAQQLGMDGFFHTSEWKQLDPAYSPRPLA